MIAKNELYNDVDIKKDAFQSMNSTALALEASYFFKSEKVGAALFLCDGYASAKSLYDALSFLSAIPLSINPARNERKVFLCEDIIPLSVVYDIKNSENPIIILTPYAFFSGIPDFKNIIKSHLNLKKGLKISMEDFVSILSEFGYSRVHQIENLNEFAVRGEIVDIYGQESPYPIRIDFFDDVIETIKRFNLNSQRSFQEIEGTSIFPINQNFYERKFNLLNILYEPLLFIENRDRISNEFLQTDENKIFYSEGLKNVPHSYDYDFFTANLRHNIKDTRDISFIKNFKQKNGELNSSFIKKIFSRLFKNGYAIVLSVKNEIHEERIRDIFLSCGIKEKEEDERFAIVRGRVSGGVISKKHKILIFTTEELFREHIDLIEKENNTSIERQDYFEGLRDINPRDFVVHVDFGVAKFLGIKRISANGGEADYLELLFDGGDKIYLPADKIYLIQKYIPASGDIEPKLSRLGNDSWKKSKKRAKDRINEVIEDLKILYAKRATERGFAFSDEDEALREFEESFEFEETEDQSKAIKAVFEDMRLNKPMDRLICGDVGFGKTEVALRAAFKAAMDGKQVAFLAPTTILVEQHFNTFIKRFENYPIKVAYLSRFVGKSEEKKVIEGINKGGIDIVIGTHKLFSEKLKFNDLGLLIIDEEQKFGAIQKEKIKKFRSNVDVLAMSATPIPRTLYMSLTGIRDLSIISTPPSGRKNIITEILEYDGEVLKHAILREIRRGGQIYFITDRISKIEENLKKLSEIIPDLKIGVAHGRMKPEEIENAMHLFYNKGYDILLSTSIIESGLDNPNVNLIIINNAENLGLSTLYQLRGRVGRSHIQAYCYLIVGCGIDGLKDEQRKRLNSIREYSELASGFKLSMADLEIRGAGNILGGAQSGHIDAVGIEMCMQMLNEEIDKMKGITLPPQINPEIKSSISAFIPDSFIEEGKTKLNFYRKLSNCNSEDDIKDLIAELEDRFGRIPREAANLIFNESLKVQMRALRIKLLEIRQKEIILNFHETAADYSELLIKFVNDKTICNYFLVNITADFSIKFKLKNNSGMMETDCFGQYKYLFGEDESGFTKIIEQVSAKIILQRLNSYVNIGR